MKKSRNYRRRIAKLTAKEIKSCQFFSTEGRKINASKVEITFQRDNGVVASVAFFDDDPHKQTIIRWYNHRYYTLRYGAEEAKPCNMTLAKWKSVTMNNN
jgi:hypothetical protein